MDRLFLDANVLFSAAYRPDAGVARLWDLDDAMLLTSDYAIVEARRNLSTADQMQRLDELLDSGEVVRAGSPDVRSREGIELPEKDWPILGGAIAARATHLVTGDVRHFGPWFGRKIFGVLVVPPAEYLEARR